MADTIEPNDYRSVLASVDKDGRRRWIEARIVWGRWRKLRAALAVPLIAFYCAIPFVHVAGRPALQLDIWNRRFYLGGLVFWPQDLSYFVILVLLGIVGTLLTVALLGRVFCGWFCPHDVFLEMVFRPIEQFCLGPHGDRRRKSLPHRALAWAGYIAVAFGLANAGTAIFTGPDAFRWYILLDVANHPYAAGFWAFFFGAIIFNFGWFREQTCTIVCPYGRFQTAMLDPHTLVVAYDRGRGEPRGHIRHDAAAPAPPAAPKLGDCIDCGLCVRVCPTAIDIRNGNQLECIHCAACIDACDQIMAKVGRPAGLIRYASEEQLAGRRRRIIRPRTILYAAVLTVLGSFLAWRLATRSDVLVTPLRQTAVPAYDRDPAGRDTVRAVLPITIINRDDREALATIALDNATDATLILPEPVITLPPNARVTSSPIVYIPRERFTTQHIDVTVLVRSADGRLLGSAVVGIRRP